MTAAHCWQQYNFSCSVSANFGKYVPTVSRKIVWLFLIKTQKGELISRVWKCEKEWRLWETLLPLPPINNNLTACGQSHLLICLQLTWTPHSSLFWDWKYLSSIIIRWTMLITGAASEIAQWEYIVKRGSLHEHRYPPHRYNITNIAIRDVTKVAKYPIMHWVQVYP